ncbi:hypothetical protein [Streptomyces sp. bgisy034]|uniref:hypothetical protein n=1 Tax=Streptomyces sp. bgisy034 TaxID=3413774 RepID=UPI003EC122C7
MPAGTPSQGAATATPTATPSQPASTTPTPALTSAAPAGAAAASTSAATLRGTPERPGCRNLAAGGEVKAAVTGAYQRAFPRFVHVRPVPGQFFYGECGGVRYAATRFEATSAATQEELVGMQDEGSVTKYFSSTSGGGWRYLASDGFPRGAHGCGDIPQIPEALSEAWGDCGR